VRDAIAMLEPRPTEIIVSTHPQEKSGWLRRKVIDRVRNAAATCPCEHVVVDVTGRRARNVLVIANETVLGEPLLERIRARAEGPASFLIVRRRATAKAAAPGGRAAAAPALATCGRRHRRARSGRATRSRTRPRCTRFEDERTDEIIVSTFPASARAGSGATSSAACAATGLPSSTWSSSGRRGGAA
jgi:hypothetical protein